MITGYINYSNSYPFLKDIQEQRVQGLEIVSDIPAALNQKLHDQTLDASAISLFEYLQHEDDYYLMPNWCINSRGHVRSVLLFSKCPYEDLSNKRILLCSESATSNNLLKLLFSHDQIQPSELKVKQEQDQLEDWDGVLLIGDPALRYDHQQHPYVTDLAEKWVSWTQGPVVFGVHAVRRDRLQDNISPLKAIAESHLRVQEKLQHDLEAVCSDIQKAFPNMSTDFIDYFRCLDFQLDEPCLKAIKRYAQESIQIGTLTQPPQLEFAKL